MASYKILGHCQSQAGAIRAAGDQRIEHAASQLRRYAVTVVLDLKVRHQAMALGAELNCDEVKINASPRQTQAFEGFQTAFLRSVASARGLSYEQVSMDWSKTNYSSARAALNEVWRTISRLMSTA